MNEPSAEFPEIAPFDWDPKRSQAAVLLASGYTHQQTADDVGVSKRTVTNWLQHVDFAAEVDRLSVMVGIASRAERLRLAMRVIRQKTREDGIQTDKDVLDWLKFAQSETDGIKVDFAKLTAAFGADEAPLAGGRQVGSSPAESESVN